MEIEKHIQTFDEFERDWKRRHRASIPRQQRIIPVQEYFWISFWVLVATGAAIFSAAHTIPAAEMTILRNVEGRADLAKTVFVVVELVIFGAAARRHEIDWLRWLLVGSIAVALAGNVGSSVTAVWQNGGDWLNQFAGILMAVIAPFTALAAGEVLHIQLDKIGERKSLSKSQFDIKYKELEAKINQAYSRYERELKGDQSSNLIKNNQISPRNKPSPRLAKALKWLEENPGNLDTPPRDLEQEVGVSYGTIYSAQKMLKKGQDSRFINGHTAEDVIQ